MSSAAEPWPALGLDIETDTSVGGLDPATAAIVAVAMCSADGHLEFVFDGEESRILREVDDLLAGLPPGLLITWNGAAFDLPFIESRARRLGIPLGLRTSPDPGRVSRRDPARVSVRARWHELVHLDGYLIYRNDVGRCLGLSCGLKSLAHLVGLGPVELDRERLHTADPLSVRRYVSSDARCAAALVERRMPHALRAADFPPSPIARTTTATREAEGRIAGRRSRATASTGSNPRPA
jgi:hypothetical protein